VRGMLYGPLDNPKNQKLTDLTRRETWILVPIVILFFVIGLFPNLFFAKINPSVDALLQDVGAPAVVQVIK